MAIGTKIAPTQTNLNKEAYVSKHDFTIGDHVEWETSQGTTRGRIKRKLTGPYKIKEHEVHASEDEPQYLVESDATGAEAAHKPEALHKITK